MEDLVFVRVWYVEKHIVDMVRLVASDLVGTLRASFLIVRFSVQS